MSATLAPQLCSPLDESPVGLRSSSAIWLFWHFKRRLRASERGLRFKWNIILFKRNDNGIKLGELIEKHALSVLLIKGHVTSDYTDAELDVTVTVRPVHVEMTTNAAMMNWPPEFF
jgi:hypothetical protein